MKPLKLTKRQAEILEFIKDEVKRRGLPPTRVEIAEHFDFRSPNAANDHVKALERKGAIKIIPTASRGIQVITWGEQAA